MKIVDQIKKVKEDPKFLLKIMSPNDKVINEAIKTNPKIVLKFKNATPTHIKKAIRLDPEIIKLFDSNNIPLDQEYIHLAIKKGANIDPDSNSNLVKEITKFLKEENNQNSKLARTLISNNIMWAAKIPNFDIKKFNLRIRDIFYENTNNIPTPEFFYKIIPANTEWYLHRLDSYYYVSMFEKYPHDPYSIKIQIRLMELSGGGMLDFLMDHELPITDEVKIAAVNEDVECVGLLPNPSKEVQLAAIKADPEAICYIQVPHPEAQMLACQMDPKLYRDIHYEVRDPHLEAFVALIDNNE